MPKHVFKISDNFISFVIFLPVGIKLKCALCNWERLKSIIQDLVIKVMLGELGLPQWNENQVMKIW